MKVFIAATYSPRGSNDQPHVIGVFTTMAKGKAAVEKAYNHYDGESVCWERHSRIQCDFHFVDENGKRVTDYDNVPSPYGGVFAVTVNKNYDFDIAL